MRAGVVGAGNARCSPSAASLPTSMARATSRWYTLAPGLDAHERAALGRSAAILEEAAGALGV